MAVDLGYPNGLAEMYLRLGTLYADWDRMEDAQRELARLESLGVEKLLPSLKPNYDDLKSRLAR